MPNFTRKWVKEVFAKHNISFKPEHEETSKGLKKSKKKEFGKEQFLLGDGIISNSDDEDRENRPTMKQKY